MAWSSDQANLGNTQQASAAASVALTTTASVISGGLVILFASYDGGANATGATDDGPGLTWSFVEIANGLLFSSLIYAVAPAGLASGRTVTLTFDATATNRVITGSSFKCGGTISTDGIDNAAVSSGLTSASGSKTAGASDLTIGGSTLWTGNGAASTATSPAVKDAEVISINTSCDKQLVILHRTDAGTHTIGTAFTSSNSWTAQILLFTEGATISSGLRSMPPFMLRRPHGHRLRRVPPALVQPTGINYVDSGTGTLNLSGSSTETHAHTSSASGSVTFSGTRTETHAHTSSASGTLTFSGTATESTAHTSSAAGTITFSGTFTQSQTHTSTASGTLTFSGTFVQSHSHTSAASGQVTFDGTGTEIYAPPGGSTAVPTRTLLGVGL